MAAHLLRTALEDSSPNVELVHVRVSANANVLMLPNIAKGRKSAFSVYTLFIYWPTSCLLTAFLSDG